MREPITKELREYVNTVYDYGAITPSNHDTIIAIADRIDVAHKCRMSNSRRESRQAAIRYLRGVLTDYDRNIKRVRKGDKAEVVRCRDCQHAREMDDRHVCTVRPLLAHLVDGDDYCSRGVRAEVDEPPMSEAAKRVYGRLMAASLDEESKDGTNA